MNHTMEAVTSLFGTGEAKPSAHGTPPPAQTLLLSLCKVRVFLGETPSAPHPEGQSKDRRSREVPPQLHFNTVLQCHRNGVPQRPTCPIHPKGLLGARTY